MTESNGVTLGALEEVVRDVLGDDHIRITTDSVAGDVAGWDSMGHINIIIAIEQRFGIRFSATDLVNLRREGGSVGSMLEIVSQRKGA